MKTSLSAFSLATLATLITAASTGCVSDQTTAAHWRSSSGGSELTDSPAGIWLVSSRMSEEANHAGNEILTETTGRQLMVVEDLGKAGYRLHECSLGMDVYYPAVSLKLNEGQLRGANAFTDYEATTPYSETSQIKLMVDATTIKGSIASYDRNLDGSYDGKQLAYLEGHRVSFAQSLEALSPEEITDLLGPDLNRGASSPTLGSTCAGIASTTTTGTQRTPDITSEAVVDVIRPEPRLPVIVAADDLH